MRPLMLAALPLLFVAQPLAAQAVSQRADAVPVIVDRIATSASFKADRPPLSGPH